MDVMHHLVDFVRRLLARESRSPETTESGEYEDLLDSVGSVPSGTDLEQQLSLKDTTITELRGNLEQLRPLGERLAAAERARLAAEQELATLRSCFESLRVEAATAASCDAAQVEDSDGGEARLVEALDQETRRVEALHKRLQATGAKLEERRSVAAERWREIRKLRSERTRLTRELEAEQRRQEKVRELVHRIAKRDGDAPKALARLIQLMQVEHPRQARGGTGSDRSKGRAA